MLFDPCGAFGTSNSNPLGLPSMPLGSSSPLTVSVALGYTPADPTIAALELMQGNVTYGPYPATVSTDAFGVSTLSLTLNPSPAGLVAGPVSLQPGTLVGGDFTAVGPSIDDGSLSDGVLPSDTLIYADAPCVSLVSPQSPLIAGSPGYVHVLVSAFLSSTPETPYDLAANSIPITLAIVRAVSLRTAPLGISDFSLGDWLVVPAGDPLAGSYARILTTLPAGYFFVYLLLGGSVLVQAEGVLTVKAGLPSVTDD